MRTIDQIPLDQAICETVREASAAARLIAADEVVDQLRQHGLGECPEMLPEADPCRRVTAVLSELPDIAAFVSLSGRTVYHDPALLSRTYARILDRKGNPAVLLAEEVRSNSREYPRPVPVELFEAPPFDLSPETIEATLRALAADPAFRDITFTTTALGAVYLFSSRYLERRYATFLAEQDESFAMDP